MIWIQWKWAKILSDAGSIVPRFWQDLRCFSLNFGIVKNRIEADVKGKIYKRNKLNKQRWCVFLILVRFLVKRKKNVWDPGKSFFLGIYWLSRLLLWYIATRNFRSGSGDDPWLITPELIAVARRARPPAETPGETPGIYLFEIYRPPVSR